MTHCRPALASSVDRPRVEKVTIPRSLAGDNETLKRSLADPHSLVSIGFSLASCGTGMGVADWLAS